MTLILSVIEGCRPLSVDKGAGMVPCDDKGAGVVPATSSLDSFCCQEVTP